MDERVRSRAGDDHGSGESPRKVVLDGVERGQTIIVTRGGDRVAEISPASRANGGALRALMERRNGEPALDGAFETEVLAVEDSASDEQDADPWAD